MSDPWHAETLDQLIVFLRSRASVRFAVVTTTSPELEAKVVTELRGRLADFAWYELVLRRTDDHEPLVTWRTRPPDTRRVVLVTGLRELVAKHAGAAIEVLGAFNLQREALAARGEALVFLTDEAAAAELMRQAPDTYRYTIGFGFERLEDWIERARAEEAREIPKRISVESDESYGRLLERSRAAKNPRRITSALLDLAGWNFGQDRIAAARGYAEEALALSRQLEDSDLQVKALETWARILSVSGRILEAIAAAEEACARAAKKGISTSAAYQAQLTLAGALVRAGRLHEALDIVDRVIDADPKMETGWKTAMLLYRSDILIRLGRLTDATESLSRDLLQPVPRHLRGLYFRTWQYQYETVGDLRAAAEAAGRACAHSDNPLMSLAHSAAWLLRRHGEIGDARKRLHSISMDSTDNLGMRAALSRLWTTIDLDLETADDRLSQSVRSCLHACQAAEFPAWISEATLLAAEVDGLAGRFPEALGLAEEARVICTDSGDGLSLADCEHTLARFHRLAGHLEQATRLAETAGRRAHEQGNRPAAARADTERAFIALTRGDAETARAHAEAALQCIGETRFRIDESAALAARAAARKLAGDDDISDEKRWRRLVRGMGARGLERRIEQSLATVPGLSGT